MVQLYVKLVQNGIRTIDQIPLKYREEVRLIVETEAEVMP